MLEKGFVYSGMNVRFLVDGFQPQQAGFENVSRIVSDAADVLGVSPEQFDQVVISDASNFGRAVEMIAPGEDYTREETGKVAMGKTRSFLSENSLVRSSIAIRSEIIDAICRVLSGGSNVNDFDAGIQLLWYTFFHEIGHCADAALRRDLEHPILFDANGLFTIAHSNFVHGRILREEFAACVHSSRFLPDRAFDSELHHLTEDATDLPGQLLRYRRECRCAETLRSAALNGLGLCWRLLIQFAKLVAFRFARGKGDVQLKIANDEKIAGVLHQAASNLIDYWHEYPHWHREPPEFLSIAWASLSDHLGYHFFTRDGRTALQFI